MNQNQQNKSSFLPAQRSVPATRESADIVIIGNGIAGLTAAIEARRYDANTRITIMTDQLHATINTPALKQFAIGKLKQEQLRAYPSGIEQSLHIDMVNAHVEKIHAESKYLSLSGNRDFGYGKLLIATGSAPNGLPANMPGHDLDGVITLHRLKDYQDLRRRLPETREAVVIGSGTHANETVMALLHCGIRVHWLIRGKKFLSTTLDTVASEMVLTKVQNAGAAIYTETQVASVLGQFGSIMGVVTNTDIRIACQLLVCCTGTSPAQGLAQQCTSPMMFKDGILVDGRLRTSTPDIYAAGDVAALPNLRTGDYETRAQWFSAVTQGKIVGAMMVGRSAFIPELFGAPWLATHLGKLSMLSVGDPLGMHTSKKVSIFTDASGGGYRRLAVVGDRLVGYLSIGTTRADGLSIKRFIDEGLSIHDLLKPLLKGKFDAHRYLTHAKTITSDTRPLPAAAAIQSFQWPDTVKELQAMQWLETEQASETFQWPEPERLEVYVHPAIKVGPSYRPEQLYPAAANPIGHTTIEQFRKPGFIDHRYDDRTNNASYLTTNTAVNQSTKPDLVTICSSEQEHLAPHEQRSESALLPTDRERVTEALSVSRLSDLKPLARQQYALAGSSNSR